MSDIWNVRARAAEAARGWIGTPYGHRASLRGAGADCLGLVRGVWGALYGVEGERPPAYGQDWASGRDELLREALGRHLQPIDLASASAGDVLLFRMNALGVASHCGVLSGDARMIHAYAQRGVVETPLGVWWMRRRVAAFRFPDMGKG